MSDETKDAIEMLGRGYHEPAIEIESPRKVIQRINGRLEEIEKAAFVKLSTAFKEELPSIDGNALKVWLFIALSVNRNTGKANPGVRTIAAGTGLEPNTVTAAIKRLEGLGLMEVNREAKKYNIYEPPAYVSANSKDPKESAQSVANFATDESQSVAKSAQSVAISGQTVATDCDLTRGTRVNKNKGVSEKTKAAIMASPTWSILAGKTYEPDSEQVALEQVRETFERIMRINAPWDRWGTFDKWLLQQEREGRPVKMFCDWFVSDSWRKNSVGGWTPKGNKQGLMSFMVTYPQAFPQDAGIAAYAPPPEPRHYTPPPAEIRAALRAKLGAS